MNTVSKVRILQVKNSLMQGKSYKQAMLDSHYSIDTAKRGKAPKIIQEVLHQIETDYVKNGMTPEELIREQRWFYADALENYKKALTKKEKKMWNDIAGQWNDRLSRHMLAEREKIQIEKFEPPPTYYNTLRIVPTENVSCS